MSALDTPASPLHQPHYIGGELDTPAAAELVDVVRRVRQIGDPVHGDLESVRGRLRLLALAVLDVLEVMSENNERPLSDHGAARRSLRTGGGHG